MKHFITLALTVLSQIAVTAHAEINRPLTKYESLADFGKNDAANGRWTISNRICGVGIDSPLQEVPANDAFQLGRDKMYLDIRGSLGLSSTTIASEYHNDSFRVYQLSHTFSSLSADQEQPVYRFEDDGSLTIMTSEFGEGGTCPVGATLFTNFVRY